MSITTNVERAKADLDAAYAAGKQAEYDAFWDAFQEGGKRVNYITGFAGKGWNDMTFFPKYDIRPSWAIVGAFLNCGVTDLEARLRECGVVLDTSDNMNYGECFAGTSITILPEIVFSDFASTVYRAFADSKVLHTIRKIVLKNGFDVVMTDTFSNCLALENVVLDGTIPRNTNMQWSTKLSKASITSIMSALSTTATGQTATFSLMAVNTAFATTAGGTDGSTSAEWAALIATRSNWTIALA